MVGRATLAFWSFFFACSAGNETTSSAGGQAAGASGPGGAGTGAGSTTTSGGGGAGGGFETTTNVGGFEQCTGVSSTAEAQKQPADIIIAVDTSGSMSEEADQVQSNLNDFATIITSSGIDVHVVLISDATVCIPAPLGSSNPCVVPDDNLPAYRHVLQTVASTDALEQILATYPQWQPSLRPNATKTFLVVTDDESDMSDSTFSQQLLALDPPTFQGFTFHAIVGMGNPLQCFGFSCPMNNPCCYTEGPFGCLSYAEEVGQQYLDLVSQSGGVSGNLCLQEFAPIFSDMAEGVIVASELSCDYAIPAPPEGETLDPTKVNVLYTPGGGMQQPIYNVPGGAADCGPEGGWYYDDPESPTKILICPATCEVLQADTMGQVDVEFGCATQIVPR
jgi:hypothetical protein